MSILPLRSVSKPFFASVSADAFNWTRLDSVDVLRGLSIFFVLMNHVNMRLYLAKISYTQGIPSQLVSSLVWNGQYGVQMFFAVSGFLITSTSIQRWGLLSRVSVRDFYVLRFARIVPLLVLLLAVLCILHAAGVTDYVVSEMTGGLSRALGAALTFHVNLLEARRGYLPASWDILWSLSVEEMFYLFFPLVFRLLSGRGIWLVVLLLSFVLLGPVGRTVLSGKNDIWREYSYLGGMDAIALGCLTAMATARFRIPSKRIWIFVVLGTALLTFILGFSGQAATWGLLRTGLDMTVIAFGTSLILAAAVHGHWSSPRVLVPLIRLGRRSYEIYLTHMFVVFMAFGVFKTVRISSGAVAILFVSVILISGLVGELVARAYADPMNRWLRQRFGVGINRLGTAVRPGSRSVYSNRET